MTQRMFREHDRVRFRLGIRYVEGIVREDRGPIGVGGRRLYLVEFRPDSLSESLSLVELPAEELQSIHDTIAK